MSLVVSPATSTALGLIQERAKRRLFEYAYEQAGNPEAYRRAARFVQDRFRYIQSRKRRRMWSTRSAIMRNPRETKVALQEIHNYLDYRNNTWVNHVFHNKHTNTAPDLKPNTINSASNNRYRLTYDVSNRFLEEDGIMNPEDCSIDVAGFTMEIELENTDEMNDIYVRMSLFKLKGTQDAPIKDDGLLDELFQDPYDKCKKHDFNKALDEKSFGDMFYITSRYNKDKLLTLNDKVVKIPHKVNYGETTNASNRARVDFQRHKRKIIFKWYPPGGMRFKLAMDGEQKKEYMQQHVIFMMHAQRKSVMGAHDDYTPLQIPYKMKIRTYFKKVY